MSKGRARKITATEMLDDGGKRLLGEPQRGGLRIPATIRKVMARKGSYYLYFVGSPPMLLTASMVRTLAKTFGDDCDDWKDAGVTLVYTQHTKLLVRRDN